MVAELVREHGARLGEPLLGLRSSPRSVSKSMIRRVGPKPATNALEAEVLALASSTRSARTRTPPRRGERVQVVGKRSRRQRMRAQEERQDQDRRDDREQQLDGDAPAVTGSHQPCGHARCAATRPVSASGARTAPSASDLP